MRHNNLFSANLPTKFQSHKESSCEHSATPAMRGFRDATVRRLITFMGRFVTGPCRADARQFHVKSAAAGRLHSRGTGKPGKRNRSELLSARCRAHLWKRSGYNGEFDYPVGRRKRASERRGTRTREIAGSLTAIRLRSYERLLERAREKISR